ncbi:hypothetical protein CPB86DRAFT_698760 [Serendipita vermifera]|nr:hypothetical protein CPB86DRAFT_698760 [Serendipita vermifera]
MQSGLSSPTCNDLNNCRKLTDILWSCLTTLFACTWLSMHPNIPFPSDSWHLQSKSFYSIRSFVRYKVPFFLMVLLVPEWVLSLAVQQWLATNRIIIKGGGERWTRTHAFFVIMGGFYAYRRERDWRPRGSEQPCYPLSADTMLKLVRQGKVALPSEEDIEDRNKSDWLAKLLVLLQTTWFVAQCVARKREGLPLTELEIVTLAYTVVNFGTCLAWWSKPRNVNRPIAVVSLRGGVPQQKERREKEGDMVMTDTPWWDKAARLLLPGFDSDVDVESLRAVPIFYSGKLDWAQTKQATKNWALFNIATLLAGMLFAGIHLIAWSDSFPSPMEQLLWRIASVMMISVPVLLCLSTVVVLVRTEYFSEDKLGLSWLADAIASGLFLLCFPAAFVYVWARLVTLYLAFNTLSSLPEEAFRTVSWTKLFPHV